MAIRLFGYTLINRNEEQELRRSPVQPRSEDSAIEIGSPIGGVNRNTATDSVFKSENALINKYRDAVTSPIIDGAVEEITSESIVNDDMEQQPVKLKFSEETMIPPQLQEVLSKEFDGVLSLMDFRMSGADTFRRWYTDGRIYFHKVINELNPADGIKELRYIDPRKIKKLRLYRRNPNAPMDEFTNLNETFSEHWLFCDTGIDTGSQSYLTAVPAGVPTTMIALDSVAYATSGLWDPTGKMVVSHIHKTLRKLNQFRMLEDAVVIYRLTRASEKRKFLISVGNLPRAKAEAEMQEMMRKFKNKLTYNSATGEINEDKRFIAMTEDYWFAVRDGEQSTDVTQLEGGANLGEVDDVELFKQDLYRALNVPIGRLDPSMSPTVDFSGQGSAISREELKFARFIARLRTRFSMIFADILQSQVILKGIATKEEWDEIKDEIMYEFARDTYYAELKELEILNAKVMALGNMLQLGVIGRFFSADWVFKNVLKYDEDTIEEELQRMADERISEAELQGQEAELNGTMQEEEPEETPPTSMAVPQMEEQKTLIESIHDKRLKAAMTKLFEDVAVRSQKLAKK